MGFGFILYLAKAKAVAGGDISGKYLLLNAYTELSPNKPDKYAWFSAAYKAYEPDPEIIAAIKKRKEGMSFVVFGGKWCPDTRKWLPQFYKVTDLAGIPRTSIELVWVNRNKKAKKDLHLTFHVSKVPAFIAHYNKKETGRIIAWPEKDMAEDLLKIIAR